LGPIITLAAALAGGALAAWAGVPAGPLVGGAVAATAAAASGLGGAVPPTLRDAAFATIGITLGAGVGPGILADLARWPASLAALAAVVALTMALSGTILRRRGMERGTALLSVSPGALSLTLALSEESGRDTRTVAILQAVRLLAVTVALPPLLALGGEVAPRAAEAPAPDTGYAAGLVLLALAIGAGRLCERAGLPAAQLMAGVTLSGAAHASGLVEGRLPAPLAFAGFVVAGAVVGARFRGVSLAALGRLGTLALALTALATVVAAAGAALVAPLLGMPFGQVMVAFAPGGVEAMASVALFLGYDPVYVGVHHIARIFGLIVVLPWILSRLGPPP
jgi:membrane AbrB-like protein